MKRQPQRRFGPPCPTFPEHGGMVQMESGNFWCPNQGHDKPGAHTRAIFTDAEATRSQLRADGLSDSEGTSLGAVLVGGVSPQADPFAAAGAAL